MTLLDLSSEITQRCYKCGEVKQLSYFAKHPTGKHGVNTTCKMCRVEYRKKHYEDNKELTLIQASEWAKNNRGKKRLYRAKRRATILSATPAWADMQAINRIYAEAAFMSQVTGVKYEVDHAVPLQGKKVCGLHVANNLQVIKMQANRSKAIKYEG